MCLKLVVDVCSEAERELVENIAALQNNKSGRGGGGKVRGASRRPQCAAFKNCEGICNFK
jgi:hypothetical protein